MADYHSVQDALKAGTDPAMICLICPWDRYCISPPAMTAGEVEKRLADATAKDEAAAEAARAEGRTVPMPATMLMTAIAYAGKDTSAQVCPVFALRLRSSGGRKIADATKALMQGWDDSQ